MDLRRLNMNKKQTFVHIYSFCVGFTLIYLSLVLMRLNRISTN